MSATYTLVIPTYNRAAELRALLGYLGALGFAHPVVVLDSSADPAVLAENDRTVSHYPGSAARQVFPGETFFYDKVREGLQRLDTELFSLCADDDFVVPAGVDALIDALLAEPALAFAQGVFGRLVEQSDGPTIYLEYKAKSYRHTTAFARVQEFLVDIESTFYSVFRRSTFLRGLDAARPLRSMLFNELFTSLAPLVQGCGVGVPVVYYVRGSGPAAQRYNRWHPVIWMCEDRQDFLAQYAGYRDLLADFIHAQSDGTDASPRSAITEILDRIHFLYVCESVISLKPYYLSHLAGGHRSAVVPTKGNYRLFPVAEPVWTRWLAALARRDPSLKLSSPLGGRLVYHEKIVARVGRSGITTAHPAIATYLDRRVHESPRAGE